MTESSRPDGDGTPTPGADALRSAVRCAVLAPSSHSTQPWLFHLDGDRMEL